ncbi:glycerol dehydrogenase [Prosthecomicrobium pneumaticum]|uniref:Glycerol dehydrogenase n=1 Tax=Prosthecomicrobium pneumaticum TaxID=81895 RepID=A0A7W9FQT3_9HYPH|nr:glycerol dehydrogenase [Prosthecomicrobium pneumaticum]MBB5755087.1 glycerol dehydrogenase [Prosthecomicrobium pneumaticum]
MARAFGGPGKYVQRAGEIARLGEHLAPLGRRPLFLVDRALFEPMAAAIAAALGADVRPRFERFGGECCSAEIGRVTAIAVEERADVVVGVGGGKTADTAKIVAIETGARIVIVPTIASTDAPCSAVAVRYTKDGVYETSLRLARNPDLVLVDSAIVAAAPPRFLIAGIGDALSTWFEARSNLESRTDNYVAGGFPAPLAGIAIARHCHDVLMRDALKARTAVEAGLLTTAVENIIEANTLLSGLGFENCGCAAAHGIHDGLTVLDEVHGVFHGEKVAFGTLCLLMLENREQAEIEATVRFCRALGLPTRLADLGIVADVREKVERVAAAALAPGAIIHATPVRLSVPIVRDAILALDAFATTLG